MSRGQMFSSQAELGDCQRAPSSPVSSPIADLTSTEVRKTDKAHADDATIRGLYCRFRILIIGVANSGKTTILHKMRQTEDTPIVLDRNGLKLDPSILDPTITRGNHDIDNEIAYPSRPNFVFHDSCGFEPGSTKELEDVRTFIERRSKEAVLQKRLHAIWYCLPTDNDRPLSMAEMAFFESGTGSVPVIAIFTKFDGLETKAFIGLRHLGMSRADAKKAIPNRAQRLLQERFLDRLEVKEHPPARYVCLRNMHKPETVCDELIEQTLEALDSNALELLFLSAQQAKGELSIKYGLTRAILEPYVFSMSTLDLTSKSMKDFVGAVLVWFPHLWQSDNDDLDNNYLHLPSIAFNQDCQIKDKLPFLAFQQLFYALHSPFFPSTGHLELQVLYFGIAILIIAAHSLVYIKQSSVDALQTAIHQYQASPSHEAITRAVEAEVWGKINQLHQGVENTSSLKAEITQALLQIILVNQLDSQQT